MKTRILFLFISLLFGYKSYAQNHDLNTLIDVTEDLKIQRISEHTYLHLSYMNTQQYGRIESNGGILVVDDQVLIFDTPHNEEVTNDLIQWISSQGWKVIGVIASHFHYDAMGGIEAINSLGIPTYGHILSPQLSYSSDYKLVPPTTLFSEKLLLSLEEEQIHLGYYGPGHTDDNIVLWFPKDQVLFGGCMIKSLYAGEGNLEDADTSEWSHTVSKIKTIYGDSLRIVVPGHGKAGGVALLDKTIKMFEDYE